MEVLKGFLVQAQHLSDRGVLSAQSSGEKEVGCLCYIGVHLGNRRVRLNTTKENKRPCEQQPPEERRSMSINTIRRNFHLINSNTSQNFKW